jgi:NHL repeat
VAVSRVTGHLYVSDGYGNSRIHKFTPDGRHVLSWGEPGIDAGQFIRPHNVVIDREDNVYVADREAHRIQVFDANGTFITMWNNIHRPDGICLDGEGNFFIGELNGMGGVDDAPGLGHRVSIYDLRGQLRARFGDAEEGEGPGQFIAPHGVAVDSRGDLYVGDVAYTIRGRHLTPPRHLKCFRKFRRVR